MADAPRRRILVTGATGLVGRPLVARLRADHAVSVLSRRPDAAAKAFGDGVEVVAGDPAVAGPWLEAVDRADAVVHLAGESIVGGAWTDAFKAKLRSSRVDSTARIAERLAARPHADSGEPRALVNASAIGYYGSAIDDPPATEETPPGDDFLARLCVDWEAASLPAADAGCRVALVRVGIVLSAAGGVLGKLLPLFRWGVGGPVGSGRQWLSWVHVADLVGLFALAAEGSGVRGPLNGTAPSPVTNRDFSRELGRRLRRPAFLTAPAFALRLALGEAADVALQGRRVLPGRAAGLGFAFRFPELGPALDDLLRKPG